MPLYFFHLYDGAEWVIDGEGLDLASADDALKMAIHQARDVVTGDVQIGCLNLNQHIIVTDESGHEIQDVSLAHAITIVPLANGPLPLRSS